MRSHTIGNIRSIWMGIQGHFGSNVTDKMRTHRTVCSSMARFAQEFRHGTRQQQQQQQQPIEDGILTTKGRLDTKWITFTQYATNLEQTAIS